MEPREASIPAVALRSGDTSTPGLGFTLPRGAGWLAQPQERGLPGSWSTSVPRTGLSQV